MTRGTVHKPVEMMGLQVPNLYVTKGAEHIRMWVDHWALDTTTRLLLHHSLEVMTVEVGGNNVWKYFCETMGGAASDSIAKAI